MDGWPNNNNDVHVAGDPNPNMVLFSQFINTRN